ncbi:hypothetical protein PIROE2DRAFT_11982 [Piromyces sp. E2]|nr:hypothetical protein PIROE2DRAFT_11982 [Piromyces sp. E2]|eukprot:OUM61912.1 hypothetical protein PIROE2DRAFT_11982 [Piromyces sp. E2]
MKFSTTLYALIATSTAALAFPQSRCDLNFFTENQECYSEYIFEKLGQVCATFTTPKCQNFYNNIVSAALNCGYSEKNRLNTIEMNKKVLEYICVNDENNQPCPLIKVVDKTKENANRVINDTCKSKICTDAFNKAFESAIGKNELWEYQGQVFTKDFNIDERTHEFYAYSFLKSDYCISKHVNNAANNANAANAANAINNTPVNNTPASNATAANNTPVINASTNNAIVTGQQNAQSSGATTMKYSVFGTLLAIAYALL